MTFLKTVFEDRQSLADTLRKHKGIRKIVEECYPDNAHFIFELLQNAEDAEASQVSFQLEDDCLSFTHDGKRPFTEKDIWSITDIGESTHSGQIGKFGVGFKSVFAYTESPRIYCRTFSFEIVNLVQPRELESRPDIGTETRFEFPFNSIKKSRERAFYETRKGLRELSHSTLMFLSNLHVIRWQVKDGPVTTIQRTEHANDHIQIDWREGTAVINNTHWLRFSNAWEDQENKKRFVSVAFSLGFTANHHTFDASTPLAEQFKIVPCSHGHVFVFFPAYGESSNLYFHVHAPFATDVSRANVKQDPENDPLYQRLSRLSASALHRIHDLGLLTEEFLAVLPHAADDLDEHYQLIRQAIVDEMMKAPLVPTLDGGHALAKNLIRSREPLRRLLSELAAPYLAKVIGENIRWTMDLDATESSRERRFLAMLPIRKFDVRELLTFLKKLDPSYESADISRHVNPHSARSVMLPISWLEDQLPEWHQKLYCTLHREVPESHDGSNPFEDLQIILLQNWHYCRGAECYLPTKAVPNHDRISLVHPEVFTSRNLAYNRDARNFLERAGVQEAEELHVIDSDLQSRYSNSSADVDDPTHLADIKRFMEFMQKNPRESALFTAAYVLKNEQNERAFPDNLFLDIPYKESNLTTFYGCLRRQGRTWPQAISTWYRDQGIQPDEIAKFAEAIGVQSELKIEKCRIENNPDWSLRLSMADGNWSDAYGRADDFNIPQLRHLLENPNLEISKLIWKTMCRYARQPSVLKAEYQNNSRSSPKTAPSQLVHILSQNRWIPQIRDDGSHDFVKPADASRQQLPDSGFPFDSSHDWLRAIGFGDDGKQDARRNDDEQKQVQKRQGLEKILGIQSEMAEALLNLAALNLSPDELNQIVAEHQRRNLPEHSPRNPERRSLQVILEANSAPARISQLRTRSVSVGYKEVKERAKEYLRNQYTTDGFMFCQICWQRSNLFKYQPDDGPETFHFVAREFLGEDEEERRQYQNYLALCPNHSAMFKYANQSKRQMRQLFKAMTGEQLEIVLVKTKIIVNFTDTHVRDLRDVLFHNR